MKLRSALQHQRDFTLGALAAFISCVAATIALAVPLEKQDGYTTEQISMVGRSGGNIFMPIDVLNAPPKYVHGSTNVTMGYIAAPGKYDCIGFSGAPKLVHGPTNISMGYVSAPASNDCIVVGATGKADREVVVALADRGRNAALTLRQVANSTRVNSGNSAAGGGSASSGGSGSGGGGSSTGGPTFGNSVGTPSSGSGSIGGLGTPDSGSGTGGGLGGGRGASSAIPSVPLPETLPMMILALAGLFIAARRKKTMLGI